MKTRLHFALLFSISSLLVPFDLDLFASGINQKKSKIELIDKDLAIARNDVLSSREYSLKEETLSNDIEVLIKPCELATDQLGLIISLPFL